MQLGDLPIQIFDTIPLDNLVQHKPRHCPLAIVDWTSPVVSARVQALDHADIFKADRTYLLVGLSGDLGQSLCEWMGCHGARFVVLTSRTPKVDTSFIRSMEALGVVVRVLSL